MQIGLVGLQYSGKTTLFNTLAGKEIDPNITGKVETQIDVMKVPDERLDNMTEIFNPKKEVYATIEVFDIPGLKMQDDGKVKITSEFLNNVKNNDALFYVIRQFDNDSVAHPMTTINPLRDINFLETEFLFYDLEFLEKNYQLPPAPPPPKLPPPKPPKPPPKPPPELPPEKSFQLPE